MTYLVSHHTLKITVMTIINIVQHVSIRQVTDAPQTNLTTKKFSSSKHVDNLINWTILE